MIEERSIIKCLLGSVPLSIIEKMDSNELYDFFKVSYFHFWKSLFPQNVDGLVLLKDRFAKYIKENKLEDLENERKWLLLHLLTDKLIAENFNFFLLKENIDSTLEELEDEEITKLEEDVNLISKILIEVDAVNYVLRYSKFKEFGIEPTVEADVLPTFVKEQDTIKNLLKENYPSEAFLANFLDLEIGSFDLTGFDEEELLTFYTDILIFKSIGSIMSLLQDMKDDDLDEAIVDFEQMEGFADFAIDSVLADLFPSYLKANAEIRDELSDLFIGGILEDLLVDE